MSIRRCPICKAPVLPPAENRWFPFDSERCKLVDLGKWFGEEYRVAGPPAREEDLSAAEDRTSDRTPDR